MSAIVAAASFFIIWLVGHNFIVALVFAIVIYLISYFLFNSGEKKEYVAPGPKEQKKSNIQLLLSAKLSMHKINQLKEKIEDEDVKPIVSSIVETGNKILGYATDNEDKIENIRSFLEYHVPTTLEVVDKFYVILVHGVPTGSSTEFHDNVASSLKMIDEAFKKQLTALLDDEIMDVSIEMETLKNTLASEGLSGGNEFDKL
jgi:5-bromo-4-chloroindolyl phosphate hydrolysis protein